MQYMPNSVKPDYPETKYSQRRRNSASPERASGQNGTDLMQSLAPNVVASPAAAQRPPRVFLPHCDVSQLRYGVSQNE